MGMIILWIVLGVIAILALWLIITFNGLIRLRNQVEEGWSDIDVQLKRRHDMIPNLINIVQGYAKHERELFEKVTQARTAAMSATSPEQLGKAENMLSSTLKSLFAVAEAYPDLKANQNFLQLQDTYRDTEDKIQASRRFYNGVVRDFNTKLQVFPTNTVGGMLGFKVREFFALESPEERKNVEIKM